MKPYRWILVLVGIPWGWAQIGWADAVERLRLDRLAAVQEECRQMAQQWQRVEPPLEPYRDARAVMHVHSHLSHDSQASLDEIVAAARELNIEVIMFTEHPGEHFDYVADGHRGMKDGVLLIPGAETGGFLAFPEKSLRGVPSAPPQPFADRVRDAPGLVFLSHLEERLDWDIEGITGSEIYNTHADVKDEANFLKLLRNPAGLLNLATALRQYPQETMATIQDYPQDYLARYDQLTQRQRLCAIAANDAHHNQALRLRMAEDRQLILEDALGQVIARLPGANGVLGAFLAGKRTGDVLAELDLDPYQRTLKHVSTHLLLREVTEAEVRGALREGRAYVAFDWMADPTSFVCWVEDGDGRSLLGAERNWVPGQRLQAAAPLPTEFRVIRDGQEVHRTAGRTLDWQLSAPGIYRVEAWLTLAGEPRPWILANPLYIRPGRD